MGRGRPKSDGTAKTPRSGAVGSKEESGGFGALGLREAPVFYPTETEFCDPLQYISSIRPLAEEYGICRIVPPASWNPPFSLDPQSFSFPTKLQAIHQLQERSAACNSDTFKLEYDDYLQKHGRVLESWPQFCGEELDLCRLYNAVKRYGGYEKVKQDKKWGEVLRMVRPSSSPNSLSSAAPSNLCHVYEKHLYNYELHQINVGCLKRHKLKLHSNSKGKSAIRRGPLVQSSADKEFVRSSRKRQSLRSDELEDTAGRLKKMGVVKDSKRLKFEIGSPVSAREHSPKVEGRTDQICEQCHGGAHEEMMLLCDRCDRGWHLYCLSPPLSAVPSGNWYCLDCISSEEESFGFGQGQEYTLDAFRRMCDRFKKKWFGGRPASHAEIERNFWDVVERSARPVNVLYGSDIDTSVYGSGFPRSIDAVPTLATQESWEEHAKSPWNLNNFPKLESSMLRVVDENIPGVIVPWLYIGMLFSSFCWHYEDHCLYSINYLHWGEPKCWYSVPGKSWEDFEKVMKSSFPDLFEAQPDLLFQLVTMLNPMVLREKGVPVCTTLQEPRNFIITFPRSYHGGFNHGFNCAEAVNFATADWLPHGSFAVDRYRFYHKEAVLSHDELLCVVAKNKCSSKTLEWLRLELTRVISTERCERERLWQHGTIKSSRMTPRARPQHIGDEEDQECIICRYYLHLSAVVCSCRPEKAVCLQHARQLCECSADKQQLLYRYSIAELEDLLKLENEVLEDCKSEDVSSDCRNHRPRIYEEQCGVRPLNTDAMKKVKGRSVRFTELAESWLSQARVETRTSPLLSVVNDLLGQAEQFLWAGHEMDLVRCMTKVLETSSVWGNDIANCYHAIEDQACGSNGQRSKVSLSWVQELVAVDPLPCMESCLPMLKVKVQEACDLQQQILSSLSASPPSEVRALQLLQKMAASSPFTYPEMQQLNEVLISAQFWSERLQKILSTGNIHSNCGGTSNVADIYQLRHLQSEGAQMPVIVPEKKLLDVVIKKVEVWQHHANQLLDSTAPLQEVEEAVKEAEDLPIYVAEAELLKKRIAEAESWIKRAASATDDSHTHSDYAASTRILKDLLLESRSLKVEVDEVTSLEKEIDRLSWMEKASKALNIKASTSYLVELTEESAKLNLEGELFSKVCKAAEDGLAWEAKAKSVLEFGACYEEFTELISSSAKINVKLSGWDDVKGAIHQSDLWLERANPFLRMHRNRNVLASTLNLQLSTLQELVIEAEFLPVLLGEAGLLRTSLIEAEAWCHKAAELEASMWSMLLCVHDTKHKQMSSENILVLDGENDITLKIQQQLSRLEELFSEGLSFGLEMPQLLKLKSLASTSRWTIKALRALSMSATMQEMESLVAEGKHLVVDLNICTMLETAIARAQDWLGKSVPILANFFSGTRVSKHLLEELLTESQAIPISLYSEVSQIKGILEAHWGWVRQVQNASDLNSTPLSSSDLFLLLEKGEADLVESEDTNFLRLKIEEACAWLKKCRQAIVSSSVDSRLSLKQLLLMLQSSLERTLELLEKVDCDRFKGIKQPACICQTPPTGPNSCLLCCDSCKDWYHPSCLGLTQFQPRTQKHFMCPFCSAVSTGVFSVKEHGLETYFSQRPAIFLLLELLDDSKEIHFRLEEKELLEKIIVSVHLWQTQVRKIVAPGLPQYSKSTVADISFLLAALKGVGRIEVEEEEKARVKLEIAVNAWHIRTKKMLDAPGKPQLRAICRALKEALSVQVPCEDKVLQDIKQRELYASRWVAHAKEVINDHGEMPVDEVQMLIAKGEELPVALTKELAALRERSVLYCVCQKPYDGDRAMIACDRCGEWYHFTCIDLPEPDSSDEDCEDAIQEELTPSGEFFCPNCRKSQRTEHLRLIDDIASERETPHSVVCTTQKHGDLPRLSSVRGKRTNRSMNKGEAMLRQEWSSELLSSGSLHWDLNTSVEGQDQSESCVNANGRPCRRTAGRHSRFESFVMLMRSR